MNANINRLEERIMHLAAHTATPGEGVSRFSYSKEDKAIRDYLIKILKEIGIKGETDPIGNIRGLYKGKNTSLAPVLIGSHIDSVKNGGKYDGVVGAIGALEVISTLYENQYIPERSIMIIFFAEEEGSNFDNTMVGSKAITGKLDLEELKKLKNAKGKSCYDLVKGFGLNIDDLEKSVIKKDDIYAMIELHIEQGAVLDSRNKKLGVVEAIAGMVTMEVTIEGVSNHAGGTPMELRNDPMVGAAKVILEINSIAKEKVNPATVATVGTISCKPNMSNIIPSSVTFRVDIRDVDFAGIEKGIRLIEKTLAEVEETIGLRSSYRLIGSSKPYMIAPRVANVIEEKIEKTGEPYIRMNSGAVHDSAMFADLTDIGMIFVPSVDGLSHQPLEYTSIEDIYLGTNVLLETVIELSK